MRHFRHFGVAYSYLCPNIGFMAQKTTSVHEPRSATSDDPERRVSIWSVPVDFGPWFYLLLVSHTAPLIFLLWWTDATPKTHDNIANIIVNVTSGSAPIIFVAAVATIIELEVLVVLREWYRDRAVRKEREKAEQERKDEEERKRLRAELERGIELGIERGRQLEREEQAARRNGNNHNGERED